MGTDSAMNFAVWRVGAPDFDVEEFLTRFPELRLELGADVHHRGSRRPGGRVHETSGFVLTVCDAASFAEALQAIRAFFNSHSTLLAAVATLGLESSMDIGVDAGGENTFSLSLELRPADLEWFAQRRLGLTISVYPVTDP